MAGAAAVLLFAPVSGVTTSPSDMSAASPLVVGTPVPR